MSASVRAVRAAAGRFRVEVVVDAPPSEVWRRLVDMDRHSARIPLTRVLPTGATMRPGLEFVAVTRLGPLHLDDRMVVVGAQAPTEAGPGWLRVTKHGPFAGSITARVSAADVGTVVVWEQELRPAWLPAVLRRPAAWFGRLAYGAGLRQLLR